MTPGAPARGVRVAVETGAHTLFVAGSWKWKWVEFFLSRFTVSYLRDPLSVRYSDDRNPEKVEHTYFLSKLCV